MVSGLRGIADLDAGAGVAVGVLCLKPPQVLRPQPVLDQRHDRLLLHRPIEVVGERLGDRDSDPGLGSLVLAPRSVLGDGLLGATDVECGVAATLYLWILPRRHDPYQVAAAHPVAPVVAEVDRLQPEPGRDLGRRSQVVLAVVEPKVAPPLIDLCDLCLFIGHPVYGPRRPPGRVQRSGSPRVVQRHRPLHSDLPRVVEEHDRAVRLLGDFRPLLCDRLDRRVVVLVDLVAGDERVDDQDVEAMLANGPDHPLDDRFHHVESEPVRHRDRDRCLLAGAEVEAIVDLLRGYLVVDHDRGEAASQLRERVLAVPVEDPELALGRDAEQRLAAGHGHRLDDRHGRLAAAALGHRDRDELPDVVGLVEPLAAGNLRRVLDDVWDEGSNRPRAWRGAPPSPAPVDSPPSIPLPSPPAASPPSIPPAPSSSWLCWRRTPPS